MAKHIEFVPDRFNKKQPADLQRWQVVAKKGNTALGNIAYYHPWSKFCFYPLIGTLYDAGCMRDIADFCETQTEEYNHGNIAEKH